MHIKWMRPKDFDDAIKATKQYWYNRSDYKFFDDNLQKMQSNFIYTFDKIFKAYFELEKHQKDLNDVTRLFGGKDAYRRPNPDLDMYKDLLPDPNALSRRYFERYENTSAKYKTLTKELRESYNKIQKACKKYLDEQSRKTTQDIQSLQKLENSNTPFCLIENNFGYLQFGKRGEKIRISRPDSQPFRLLQSLTEPFGIAKRIEIVFEAMREGVRNKGTGDSYLDKNRKIQAIQYSGIKELQKNNKFREKLKFEFDNVKSKVWLRYIG